MKVGILCAGDREFEPFIKHICDTKISERAMLRIYEGAINGVNIAALFSGVCKVNAAIATQILIDYYDVDVVINAGTAGGMNEELEIFDTVISTEVAYHDVSEHILTEFHPWLETIYFQADQELLRLSQNAAKKMQKTKVVWGRMVTGEYFVSDEGREEINKRFAPLTVDMETASIAHVCYVNQIPFISIRCITDTAKHSGTANFEQNCEIASEIAKDMTLALINEIKERK